MQSEVVKQVLESTGKGCRFASLLYRTKVETNATGQVVDGGELSRYSILLGTSVTEAYQKDVKRLKARLARLNKLPQSDTLRVAAIKEIIASRETSLTVGVGNNPAYTLADVYLNIGPGIRIHKETGELYIFGNSQGKTVIEKGVHKVVNSKPLTIAKRKESKTLPGAKWRLFRISPENLKEIRANGETLEVVAG